VKHTSVRPNKPVTTYGQRIVDHIFKLDAQYQDGSIKAKSREDFVRTNFYSLVDKALELEYNRGKAARK
jgi:hypothetical protein